MTRRIKFNIESEYNLKTIDYYNCWNDLQNELNNYLIEKGGNKLAEDGEKYCVALSINDILDLMSEIEKKNIKNNKNLL